MDIQTVVRDRDSNRSRLVLIPTEVLLLITYSLTTPEYGNLRRTCKHIEATLFTSFSREFFTKRQFMLTDFSLQALVDISKSRFSFCLSHVILGLERLGWGSLPVATHMVTNPLIEMDIKSNYLWQEYLSHTSLLNTGQDVEMLTEAFSNLDNLETVGIRDFYSRSRNRDYPNTEWKSYGVSTFQLNAGSNLDVPRRRYLFNAPVNSRDQASYLSRVFLNLLRALGKASSQPKHFEVILRESSLQDHAFNLPKYVEPDVQPVLANLRTLFLDLNSDFPSPKVDVLDESTGCPSYLLRKFLSRTSQLEHLRLNFQSYGDQVTSEVLSWLSKPTSAHTSNSTSGSSLFESPQVIHLTKLRRLDIGMIVIEPQILLAIVRKYRKTLRTISFHKVSLLHADLIKSEDRQNLWAKFFGQLSKIDLELSAINLSFLSQEQAEKRNVQSITFKDSQYPKSKVWTGSDIQSGLRDIASSLMVSKLEDTGSSNNSNESDEEDLENSMSGSESDIDDDGMVIDVTI